MYIWGVSRTPQCHTKTGWGCGVGGGLLHGRILSFWWLLRHIPQHTVVHAGATVYYILLK